MTLRDVIEFFTRRPTPPPIPPREQQVERAVTELEGVADNITRRIGELQQEPFPLEALVSRIAGRRVVIKDGDEGKAGGATHP